MAPTSHWEQYGARPLPAESPGEVVRDIDGRMFLMEFVTSALICTKGTWRSEWRVTYDVWLLNNKTAYEKEVSPSMNSPPLATHRSICFFHWSKQCWKSSFVRALRSFADFRFTASIDSNPVPFKADLIFGNKKKSQGANSGEYDAVDVEKTD